MEQAFQVGDVLHYYCYVASKEKFHVVVCITPEILTVLINSEINSFIKGKPRLMACNTVIRCSDHPFLNYDSYIFCCDTHVGPRSSDPVIHVGEISEAMWPDIIEAVKASPTMSRRHKKWILGE
ncbi:MAG: hypothetical protein GY746_17250 [Gammaproteobacteria bacterium]|nr:hypothetical protein [Gammaproteobacteria bacterium]